MDVVEIRVVDGVEVADDCSVPVEIGRDVSDEVMVKVGPGVLVVVGGFRAPAWTA
jgi:hypothetical protein